MAKRVKQFNINDVIVVEDTDSIYHGFSGIIRDVDTIPNGDLDSSEYMDLYEVELLGTHEFISVNENQVELDIYHQ